MPTDGGHTPRWPDGIKVEFVPLPTPDIEFDNHHNAAICPHCTHSGEFVMVPRRLLDVLHQAVADGEVHTTKPVNRALIELFDALT